MKKINGLNKKQRITVIILVTVFVVSLLFFVRNISQINKINASISDLIIKNNIVILNVNSTKQKLINKIGDSSISVKSNNIEIQNSTIIKTGDILKYNNKDYKIAILGDVNNDGVVSGSDVSQIYSKYKNRTTLNEVQTFAADINNDNVVSGSDVSSAYSLYKNPPIEPDDQVTYTVTLNSNDATTNGSTSTTVKTGNTTLSTITLPQKKVTVIYVNTVGAKVSGGNTQRSYTLKGWYTSATNGYKVANNLATPELLASVSGYTNSNKQWIRTSNATLYAHWDSVTAILPVVTKEGGYTCNWSTNSDGIKYVESGGTWTFSTANSRTFTANCTKTQFKVTFNSDGDWTSVDSITKNYNEEIGTLPTSRKTGHNFDGWYTSKTGGTKITETTKVTKDITYYARFIPKQYTITYYYMDNGIQEINVTKNYGDTLGTLPTINMTCYSLLGWFDGDTQITSSTIVTKNKRYFGKTQRINTNTFSGDTFCGTNGYTGWQNVNNNYYYLINDIRQKGWLTLGRTYYLDSNGIMQIGWQNINGITYYFYNNQYGDEHKGQMAHDEFIEGYWLNSDGSWVDKNHYSWASNTNGYYYGYKKSETDYWWAINKGYYIDGKYYHFNSNGYCDQGC